MKTSYGVYGRRGKLVSADQGVRKVASTFGKVRNLTFSKKCSGELVVDCDAERFVAHMLTIDPRVKQYQTQPFTVDLIDQRLLKTPDELTEARKKHSQRASPRFYTPDFAIDWQHTTRSALEVKLEGYEGDEIYQKRLLLGSAILDANAYRFATVVIPADPKHPLRCNIPLLKKAAARIDLWPDDSLVGRITDICALQPVTLKDLCGQLNISPNLVPTLLVIGCVASNLTEHFLCGTMPLSAAYGDLSHLQMLERFAR